MKSKLLYLLLMGSIVSSMMLSSCKKSKGEGPSDDEAIEKGTFTDSRDNKTYNWVKIGNQVWMAENLAYTGSGIVYKPDIVEWMDINSGYNGWCYFDNSSTNGDTYGVLYQWDAAQAACPPGWHLPTQDEWLELIDYLADHGYSYDGYTGVRDIAKSIATADGWAPSTIEGAIGNSDYPEVQNITGFSALPAGKRQKDGVFVDISTYAYWWTATEDNVPYAFYHTINNDQPYENYSNANMGCGFSVRCVKD